MPYSLFLFLLLGALWWGITIWAIAAYHYKRPAAPLLLWPAQLSGLAIVFAILILAEGGNVDEFLAFIAVIIFPPLVLAMLASPSLLLVNGMAAVLAFLAVFGVPRSTRPAAPVLASVTAFVGLCFVAGSYFDSRMCASAIAMGATDVQRAPFWYNVARRSDKGGREPYGIAYADGQVYDWSYSRERFLPYGDAVESWADTSRFEPLDCGP